MSDRMLFREFVLAALLRVHRLSMATALAALADRYDLFALGLPAEECAAMVAADLQGERPYAPREAL